MRRKKKARKYTVRYRANIPDCEATIEKAQRLGLKVRLGGGRPTRGGEPSEWGQFVVEINEIDSTVEINTRSGIIQFSYPSIPKLRESAQILSQFYVPMNGSLDLTCEGPVDPLDRAFEFTVKMNWMGKGVTYVEAKTHLCQWLDAKTGEYIFRLPDREDRITHPENGYIFQGCCPIKIIAIDKDDQSGNRIVTAERIVWKGIKELKRIVREHPRFKPE